MEQSYPNANDAGTPNVIILWNDRSFHIVSKNWESLCVYELTQPKETGQQEGC